jgi:hypothetical protein
MYPILTNFDGNDSNKNYILKENRCRLNSGHSFCCLVQIIWFSQLTDGNANKILEITTTKFV